VHGILVQLPLPVGLPDGDVVQAIAPAKDVDGLNRANVGSLWRGEEAPRPCTPSGCLELCDRYDVLLRGPAGGGARPLPARREAPGGAPARAQRDRDPGPLAHARIARPVPPSRRAGGGRGPPRASCAAAGSSPAPASSTWGSTAGEDGKLCGDVDFDEVSAVAGLLSPVPGGVGPMTIAMLIRNTARAAALAAGHQGL
jgi:methylenetetrahydrofolate dehydrogenase (NADP+)/methenyltetrahydrofolate cyclohydrolase